MSTDYTRLRELAEKATPGPWQTGSAIYGHDFHETIYVTPEVGHRTICDITDRHSGNAEFIAAVDPQTVIALLDERDRLRNALARILGYTRGAVERLMPDELAELEGADRD